MYGRLQEKIQIPEDITLTNDGAIITVKGKLGELSKDFRHTGIQVSRSGNSILLTTTFPKKKEKALLGTVKAHINNMIRGTSYGFKYSMKIVFSHFPLKVTPKKSQVTIENLYGGRSPRYAPIIGKTKVVVDGENIFVSGVDREAVGQTCANIQEITRQRGKRRQSPKTFMDGVFTYQRGLQSTD